MSSPMSIPRRNEGGGRSSDGGARDLPSPLTAPASSNSRHHEGGVMHSASSSAASSYAASSSSTANTPAVSSPLRLASFPNSDASMAGMEPRSPDRERRRASLMSSALAASEHTVVNIGGPDGPPRLITCVRSSQGFDWNQEIFLPSHYDHLIPRNLERKRDPVHDIVLTDEDIYDIFPQ